MRIDLVVGARPNFVKAAAILHAAKKFPQVEIRLLHTGQHQNIMSDPYFKDLELPVPDQVCTYDEPKVIYRLASMMMGLYVYWEDRGRPDYCMVVGDTDSTLAGALAAAKSGIPVIHVEAGMRCGDMKMQEEINRILVDSIAVKHYASSTHAYYNLMAEGRDKSVRMVGNVMVDTLLRFLPQAIEKYPSKGEYAVFTLHRAENVDDHQKLRSIVNAVAQVSEKISVVWPVHPRIGPFVAGAREDISVVEPMGYLEFIALLQSAKFVMTDSGGVQEETTALGVPCLTLRGSTERPETVSQGTNRVIGTDPRYIVEFANASLRNDHKFERRRPDGYDGHAAERILEDLCATS